LVSRSTVEIVREGYDAWNRGNFDVLRRIYASEVTADAGELWPSSGEVTGADAIIAAFESIQATFEHCELVPEQYIEHGESVVVPTVWKGTLVGSSSVIRERVIAVYTLRASRIARIAYFEHLDDAMRRVAELEPAGI
jgi:ketosteroid isomerase-like protein